MRLITRNTDYAIRALCFIAQNGKEKEIISAAELVRKLKIPRPFLRKILQILNKRGILSSRKGLGGGFSLAIPPKNIFLIDLIETLQGSLKLTECIFKKRICSDIKTCVLKKKIGALERYMTSELKAITLASLLQEEKR